MALSELVSVTGMVTAMHPLWCPRREHLMFLLLVHLQFITSRLWALNTFLSQMHTHVCLWRGVSERLKSSSDIFGGQQFQVRAYFKFLTFSQLKMETGLRSEYKVCIHRINLNFQNPEEQNTQRCGITQESGSSAGGATTKLHCLAEWGQPVSLSMCILRDAPHSNKPTSVERLSFALYFVFSLSTSHSLEIPMPCPLTKSQVP